MRNLKRVLSLALALVMVLGMMVIGTSAASFTDAEEITYIEAMDVMAGLGVFKGDDNGNVNPTQVLTRKEAAVIMARIILGEKMADSLAPTKQIFSDVPLTAATEWYAAEVEYCYNIGMIGGNGDGTFNPDGKLTGTAFAKLLLCAMGYDAGAQGYTGKDWNVNINNDALRAGLWIEGVNVNAELTREGAAQMLFQALENDMVEYMTSYDYATGADVLVGPFDADETFMGEYFPKLVKTEDGNGDWGRPYEYAWFYGTAPLYIAWETALATYIEPTKTCDIYKDTGLKKNTVLEVYVNSNTAGDNGFRVIDTQVNAWMTKQGRLVEVYSDCVVCIDTYLAKVIGTTPEKADRNGHITPATTTFGVYGIEEAITEVMDGYTKGEYALVTVLDGALYDIELTEAETVGTTKWFNNTATTIGSETYMDAYEFVLNYVNAKVRGSVCWDVFVDQYGNLIGVIPTADNYLVVEKIEWKHAASTIGDGYVLADVVLADGTELKNVTVDEVNGDYSLTNAEVYTGSPYYGNVADSYANNKAYYNHIYTYTVDAYGNYAIATHDNADNIVDYEDVTIVNGQATIDTKTNVVVATNNTVFLIKNRDGYTYTTYVGKNEVPSGTADEMCVMLDANGYAELVVLDWFTNAGNSFLAYVGTDAPIDYTYSSRLGFGYEVYKFGETEATVVYDNASVFELDETHGTGLYTIVLNNKGQVTAMAPYVCDVHCDSDWSQNNMDRAIVEAAPVGTSFQTVLMDGDTANKDFNITDETVVIDVTVDNYGATLKDGSAASIKAGKTILVKYTVVGTRYTANVIYVITDARTAPAAPVVTYAWEYKNATMDINDGAQIEIALAKTTNGVKEYQTLKSASNLTVKVEVYNKAGTLVYSTTVAASVNASGNLLVEAPHTLTAGNEYKAIVTISGSSYVEGVATVSTPYIEAQDDIAAQA